MKNLLTVWSLATVLTLGVGQAAGQFVWTKDARNPILSGAVMSPDPSAWDNSVEIPWVIRENGQYKMWYEGNVDGQGGQLHYQVSVAESITSEFERVRHSGTRSVRVG